MERPFFRSPPGLDLSMDEKYKIALSITPAPDMTKEELITEADLDMETDNIPLRMVVLDSNLMHSYHISKLKYISLDALRDKRAPEGPCYTLPNLSNVRFGNKFWQVILGILVSLITLAHRQLTMTDSRFGSTRLIWSNLPKHCKWSSWLIGRAKCHHHSSGNLTLNNLIHRLNLGINWLTLSVRFGIEIPRRTRLSISYPEPQTYTMLKKELLPQLISHIISLII